MPYSFDMSAFWLFLCLLSWFHIDIIVINVIILKIVFEDDFEDEFEDEDDEEDIFEDEGEN